MALRGVRPRGRRRARRARAAPPVAVRVRAHRASTRPRWASRSAPISICRRSCASTPGPRRRAGRCGAWSSRPRCRCSSPPATGWRGPPGAGCSRSSAGRWCGSPRGSSPTRRCSPPRPGSRSPRSGSRSCLGIAVSVFVDGIHSFKFGWRQPAVILGAVAILLPALLFTGDVVDGRWHAPVVRLDEHALVHAVAHRQGRVPDAVGRRPERAAARSGRAARRHRLHAHPQRPRRRHRAVAGPRAHGRPRRRSRGRSRHCRAHQPSRPDARADGRALRRGAEHPGTAAAVRRPSVPGAVRSAMAQQLDLAQLRSSAGIVLYENLAYAPIARGGSRSASRSTRRGRTAPRSAPTSRTRPPLDVGAGARGHGALG